MFSSDLPDSAASDHSVKVRFICDSTHELYEKTLEGTVEVGQRNFFSIGYTEGELAAAFTSAASEIRMELMLTWKNSGSIVPVVVGRSARPNFESYHDEEGALRIQRSLST